MKLIKLIGIAASALLFALPNSAAYSAETVVTFDNLTVDGSTIPDGYGGVTWNGNWDLFTNNYFPYTAASSPNSIFLNYPSVPASFSAPVNFLTPVVFDGADFSGYNVANVTFDLYLNGVLKGTSSTLETSSTPTFLASGYTGLINQVDVVTNNSYYFVMDNFTYGSSVPEPSSWAMMLLGIGVTGGLLRLRARVDGAFDSLWSTAGT